MLKQKKMYVLMAIIFFISVFTIVYIQAAPKAEPTTEQTTEPTTQPEEILEVPLYTVKEYDGKIAIYEHGGTSPLYLTNSYINNLPAEDQIMLKSGIDIYSKDELSKLLEDYDADEIIFEY